MQVCEESGTDLAQAVKKKLKAKEKSAGALPAKAGRACTQLLWLGVESALCSLLFAGGLPACSSMYRAHLQDLWET